MELEKNAALVATLQAELEAIRTTSESPRVRESTSLGPMSDVGVHRGGIGERHLRSFRSLILLEVKNWCLWLTKVMGVVVVVKTL